MNPPTAIAGNCHCGNLSLRLTMSLAASEIHPRACDCSFCRKHGAAYVSDSAGQLRLEVKDRDQLGSYRQGSGQAELLFCQGCGVLVAAVYEANGVRYATVNAQCLDANVVFGASEVSSPQHLAPDAKTDRWKRLWFKRVELVGAASAGPSPG